MLGKFRMPDEKDMLSELVRWAVYRADRFDSRLKSAPEVDSRADNVWTAVFPDMMLLYNNGDKPASVERAWQGRTYKAHLEPGELVETDLAAGPGHSSNSVP